MVERGWATDAEAAALAFKFADELVDLKRSRSACGISAKG
jgi:hypothetical protein